MAYFSSIRTGFWSLLGYPVSEAVVDTTDTVTDVSTAPRVIVTPPSDTSMEKDLETGISDTYNGPQSSSDFPCNMPRFFSDEISNQTTKEMIVFVLQKLHSFPDSSTYDIKHDFQHNPTFDDRLTSLKAEVEKNFQNVSTDMIMKTFQNATHIHDKGWNSYKQNIININSHVYC